MENLRQSKELDYDGSYYLPLTLNKLIGEEEQSYMLYFNRNRKFLPQAGRRFSNIRFKMSHFKGLQDVNLTKEQREDLRKIHYFDSPIPPKYDDCEILYFLLKGFIKGNTSYKIVLVDNKRGNLVLDYVSMTSSIRYEKHQVFVPETEETLIW